MMLTKLKYAGMAPAIMKATLHQIGTMIAQRILPFLVINGGALKRSMSTLLYSTLIPEVENTGQPFFALIVTPTSLRHCYIL